VIKKLLRKLLCWLIDNKDNPYHPFVWINGNPIIGKNVYIGGFSEVYSKGATVFIGDNCDIASFVVINCADSHMKVIGKSKKIERKNIFIGKNVFIGTQSTILGGTIIGHHSVIGAGVVLKNRTVLPYSRVYRDFTHGKTVINQGLYR
jgi:acetyltransferase-like isoleucine patch superfamily enzyme